MDPHGTYEKLRVLPNNHSLVYLDMTWLPDTKAGLRTPMVMEWNQAVEHKHRASVLAIKINQTFQCSLLSSCHPISACTPVTGSSLPHKVSILIHGWPVLLESQFLVLSWNMLSHGFYPFMGPGSAPWGLYPICSCCPVTALQRYGNHTAFSLLFSKLNSSSSLNCSSWDLGSSSLPSRLGSP